MPSSADPFFEPYDRDQIAYGTTPSAALQAMLDRSPSPGQAFDLGAGAGRDTIALAAAGYDVTAVDMSSRGLERIAERAKANGLSDRVRTLVADVRELEMQPASCAAVVATTVLDHIPADDAPAVWRRMAAALTESGFLFVEVHTTEDPGSDVLPGSATDAPVSETAGAVVNYFAPNQLAKWATSEASNLRILQYEERREWDYTHGPLHLHGKAILLAVRRGHYPDWYGQPPAFPIR